MVTAATVQVKVKMNAIGEDGFVTANWELALIAAIEKEIAQLEWLIACEGGEEDVERSDIHAQISRIGGLTDLSYADGFPLSETGIAQLRKQGERVMELARSISFGRSPSE